MLALQKTVGRGGRNRVDDVAIIQLTLKYLHRGVRGTGPYYKGQINGNFGGPFTGAYQDFLRAHKHLGLNLGSLFSEGSPAYKELKSYLGGSNLLKADIIKGTSAIYMAGKRTSAVRYASEYLIPASLKPKRIFKLGEEQFDTKIELVFLTTFDSFAMEFSFPKIVKLVDPYSLKLVDVTLTDFFKKQIITNLRGTPWKLGYKGKKGIAGLGAFLPSPKKGVFTVESPRNLGLLKEFERLHNAGIIKRVLISTNSLTDPGTNTKGFGYYALIPTREEILQISALIQAVVCAGKEITGVKGTVEEKVDKLTKTIIKQAPNIRYSTISSHCSDCEGIKKAIKAQQQSLYSIQGKLQEKSFSEKLSQHKTHLITLAAANNQDTSKIGVVFDAMLSFAPSPIPIPVDGEKLLQGELALGNDDRAASIGFIGKEAATRYLTKKATAFVLVRGVARLFWLTGIAITLYDLASFVFEAPDEYEYENSDGQTIGDHISNAVDNVLRYPYNFSIRKEIGAAKEYFKDEGVQFQKTLRAHNVELANGLSLLDDLVNKAVQQKCGEGYY